MSEYKTPEEILEKWQYSNIPYRNTNTNIIEAMKEYARQEGERRFIEGRDKALDAAIDKAEQQTDYGYFENGHVDVPDLIKLKKAKELQP